MNSPTSTPSHTTDSSLIAANIRALREERHMSQAHLAGAAGLSERTVQRAEETGNVHGETLLAIAGALDVDVSRLKVDIAKVMRAVEALQAKQKEDAAKFNYVPLVAVDSSARCADVAAADGWVFDTELEDDATQDAITELRQYVGDVGNLWSELEPVQRRESAKEMFELVEKVTALGRKVKVGFTDKRFRAGAGGPVTMRIAIVVIADKNDERTVAALPKSGHVTFEV